MASDKRDFSDFTKFPGSINPINKAYEFPALYHVDHNKNTRIWSITVRLVKGGEKKYDIDWDIMEDDIVPVKPLYLKNGDIPEGTSAQVYVETGVIGGKITRHTPSYPKIMNEGKANERNEFEQGLVEARSLYLKKVENGFKTEINFKKKKSTKKEKNIKYFPMLVRKYDDEKKHLEYPLYAQPKLDGARCIIFLNKSPKKNPTIDNIIMYTRQKKDYIGFDNIKEELLPALIDMWDFEHNESVYVDGELYKHGLSLQTISGAVRNPKRDNIPEYKGIKYWIFDLFYPSELKLDFEERIEHLEDLFDAIGDKSKYIVEVPIHKVNNEADQEKLYKSYLKKKYEGIILRNAKSLYLTHPTKNSTTIRSKYVLKRKMKYTDEFEVVGFDQGKKGKDKGAIIWICKTHNTNKKFNTTPKDITYDERYKLYKKAMSNNKKGFDDNYKGRMMTIEYEDLSEDKIPLRAKSIGFREHI